MMTEPRPSPRGCWGLRWDTRWWGRWGRRPGCRSRSSQLQSQTATKSQSGSVLDYIDIWSVLWTYMEYVCMFRIMDIWSGTWTYVQEYGSPSGCIVRKEREYRLRWSPAVCSWDCCWALLHQTSKADEETVANVGEAVLWGHVVVPEKESIICRNICDPTYS